MKVKGQLEDAQLHNKTSDPSVGQTGRVWVRTDTNKAKFDDGAAVREIATLDQTQTLTNKTIAAGSNTVTGLTNTNLSGSAAISNANLTTMAAHTYKGNNTGSTAAPLDLTAAQVLADISPLTTKGDLRTYSTLNTRLGVGNNGQALVADSSQTTGLRWGSVAGGGSKNYLATVTASTSGGVANTGNGDFELGTTSGWALGNVTLTLNFPSGVPTFGSGASGNLSIAAVTSSQLAGSTSMSYVSSAATTAGNFVASNAFFIDLEDQAKILSFKFAYQAFSGTTNCNFSGTASNSFGVAIYDVSGSAWIQPSGCFGMTQGTGVGVCTGTFQTSSTGTQYRIVVYNANATAGAATIYFDDFTVGPQVNSTGIISKPITTQTFLSGTAQTYTSPAGVYQIRVRMVGGGGGGGSSGSPGSTAPTAGAATTFGTGTAGGGGGGGNGNSQQTGGSGGTGSVTTSGTVLLVATGVGGGGGALINSSGGSFNVMGSPGGSSLMGGGALGGYNNPASSASANTGGGGAGCANQGGTNLPTGSGGGGGGFVEFIITNPSPTYTYTVGAGGNGGGAGTSGGNGGAGGSGVISIQEYYYGTNVQLSSDTDTRVVAAIASGSSTTVATSTTIIPTSITSDTHGSWVQASGIYTCPISGFYECSASMQQSNSGTQTAGAAWEIYIYKNGSQTAILGGQRVDSQAGATGTFMYASGTQLVSCVAGDTLKFVGNAGVSSTINQYYASIRRLSGPAVVQATESVNMNYTDTAGTAAVGVASTAIAFGVKSYDSHNAYSGSLYTVPVSGKYRVTATIVTAAVTLSATQNLTLTILKTGSQVGANNIYGTGGAGNLYGINANGTFNCVAGDTIQIKANASVATTLIAGAGWNNLSIERVGN